MSNKPSTSRSNNSSRSANSNRRPVPKRRPANNRKIVNYKSPINMNPGMLIMGLIVIYVIISVIVYLSTNRLSYYEVVSGTVADDSDRSFTALALRSEKVSYADTAGYINYYARDNSRVSKKTTLYSIDESGQINTLLDQMSNEDKQLSDENISSLKEVLYNFTSSYDSMDYSQVYDFKNSLSGMVAELINTNAIQSIYESLGDSKAGQFQINTPENSGIVEYYIDNYEDITTDALKASLFDMDNYTCVTIKSGQLVEKGAPIYKTVTDEEWNLVIPLDDENYSKYQNTTVMKIRFKENNTAVTTNFKLVDGTDGSHFGVLTFQKYMIQFATERFVDIEIVDYNIQANTDQQNVASTDNSADAEETTSQASSDSTDTSSGTDTSTDENDDSNNEEDSEETTTTTNDDLTLLTDENKTPLKIPKSSVITKEFYVVPKEYKTSGADDTDSGFIIYDPEVDKDDGIFSEISIFYEDDKYCYISMDKLEAGQIIIPPADQSLDNYTVKEKQGIAGVYNINNGYTQFAGVTIIDDAEDYYIVYALNENNLMIYDHIVLNAENVDENQVIFQTN